MNDKCMKGKIIKKRARVNVYLGGGWCSFTLSHCTDVNLRPV